MLTSWEDLFQQNFESISIYNTSWDFNYIQKMLYTSQQDVRPNILVSD